MATFVLIHGAGDVGWYWHLVERELRAAGHDVVAPDLPIEDDAATLEDYAGTVIRAIGDRQDLVLVAQSAGGFTAPLVAARRPVRSLVLVAGMIPRPGEKGDDWFAHTGWQAPAEEDPRALFYHDVPAALAEEALRRGRRQSETAGAEPWPLAAWPAVTTRFVLCTEDRFFPAPFLRRVLDERLGVVPDELAAGHCVALSRPKELAALLVRAAADGPGTSSPRAR